MSDSVVIGRDQITNFDVTQDVFAFEDILGLTDPIAFIEVGGFTGGGGSEALLDGSTLQIDINGDTTADMEIELLNLQGGTLSSSNFSVLL